MYISVVARMTTRAGAATDSPAHPIHTITMPALPRAGSSYVATDAALTQQRCAPDASP